MPSSGRRYRLRAPLGKDELGDHLEELRSRVIKALLGVFIAFFGGLDVAKQYLLPYVAGPLIEVLTDR